MQHPIPAPERFSPPWAFALGLAAGFYPRFLPLWFVLLGAVFVAAFAATLRGLSGRGAGLKAWLAVALACGLALGAGLRRDEAGKAVAPLPRGDLAVTGLWGRLHADAARGAGGLWRYPLALEGLKLAAPGLRGSVSARGRVTLLVRPSAGESVRRVGERLQGERLACDAQPARPRKEEAAPQGAAPQGAAPPETSPHTTLFFADEAKLVRLDDEGRGLAQGRAHVRALGQWRARLRTAFRDALSHVGGDEATAGLLVALLLGDRTGLERDEAAVWKRAGCAHVLALSGQHLALLATLAAALCRPLCGPRRARGLALLCAAAFVFVAGLSPSLLRSLLMYGIGVCAFFADRPVEGRTTLALAFAIALPLDPEAARGLSFCLSYLALAGLVVFAPRIEFALRPWLPPALATALAASLGAQLATGALLALVFGALQPIGIVASIATAPLVAAFLWWGLCAGLSVGLVPRLAPLVVGVSRFIYRLLAGAVSLFAAAPPLVLPGRSAAFAAAVVVLVACLVYALPHVRYRLWLRSRQCGDETRL